MSEPFRVVECPSCGAPLQMTRQRERVFQCEFCGTVLEDQSTARERAKGQKPKVVISSTAIPHPPTTPQTTISNRGCVLTTGCLFLIVIAVVGLLFVSPVGKQVVQDIQDEPRVYSFGWARMLPSDNDTQPDLVGVTHNSDDTVRLVYVDFDATPPLRWQSEGLSDDASYVYNPMSVDRTLIYLAYKDQLTVFSRQDGDIAWQIALSDEVSHACQDCLQPFGDWLVALTTDGQLNGIKAQSGELGWSLRLTTTPRQLLNLADRVGVPDEGAGPSGEEEVVGINVYDPASGDLIQRFVPQCPNEPFPNDPQELGLYDPVLLSDDGKGLYVPAGFFGPGCIQKWDTASLSQVWQTTMPIELVRSLEPETHLLTEKALYLSYDDSLSVLNLSDGTYRELFSSPDYNLFPLAAQDDTLVILAERTRGSRRHELWGIDLAEGSRRWQFNPSAEAFYEGDSSVVYEEGLWAVGMRFGQVVVLEAFAEPVKLTFTLLNLADGSQEGASELSLDGDSSSYWFQVLGWHDDQVYLEIDGQLRLIDVTTATQVAAWP